VLALATAAVALIASVQFTYNTRQFLWSAADVRGWWPELPENSELETRLRGEQAESFGRWQAWARWARTAHGAGVLILLAGLALALPPPPGGAQGACAGRHSASRPPAARARPCGWRPGTGAGPGRPGRRCRRAPARSASYLSGTTAGAPTKGCACRGPGRVTGKTAAGRPIAARRLADRPGLAGHSSSARARCR
jgi:hypothetical protein